MPMLMMQHMVPAFRVLHDELEARSKSSTEAHCPCCDRPFDGRSQITSSLAHMSGRIHTMESKKAPASHRLWKSIADELQAQV
jgi:hypothetical protein